MEMYEEDMDIEFLKRFNISDFSIAKYEKDKLSTLMEIGKKIVINNEELKTAMESDDLIVFNHHPKYVVYKTLKIDNKIKYLLLFSTSKPFHKKNVDFVNFVANLVTNFLQYKAS